MQTDFKLSGGKEMEALLKQIGPELANKIGDQALRAGAREIIKEAKALVPVRTGKLRDSIVLDAVGRRNADGERAIYIGFKKPHSARAHLAEFGTRHSAARPFMRPALDTKAGDALEAMRKTLARGLSREARKLAKP